MIHCILLLIFVFFILYFINLQLNKEFFQNESNIKDYKFKFYLGKTKSEVRDKVRKLYDEVYKPIESTGPTTFELIDLTKKDNKYYQDNLINPNIDYEVRYYENSSKKCDYKIYLGKFEDLESYINNMRFEINEKVDAEEDLPGLSGLIDATL